MEGEGSPETLITTYQTTWCHKPKYHNINQWVSTGVPQGFERKNNYVKLNTQTRILKIKKNDRDVLSHTHKHKVMERGGSLMKSLFN
jgi:hypothetical protein